MSANLITRAWGAKGLTTVEKLVLLRLADEANGDGECWPSVAMIAGACGVSERSVPRALSSLEKGGHLTVKRLGNRNLYGVHPSGNNIVDSQGVKPSYPDTMSGCTLTPCHPDTMSGYPDTMSGCELEKVDKEQVKKTKIPRIKQPEMFPDMVPVEVFEDELESQTQKRKKNIPEGYRRLSAAYRPSLAKKGIVVITDKLATLWEENCPTDEEVDLVVAFVTAWRKDSKGADERLRYCCREISTCLGKWGNMVSQARRWKSTPCTNPDAPGYYSEAKAVRALGGGGTW